MVFHGGYHGGVLYFVSGGSPVNVPYEYIVAPYNDVEGTRALLAKHGGEIFAVLIEPMQGSHGCLPGDLDFLKMVREETKVARHHPDLRRGHDLAPGAGRPAGEDRGHPRHDHARQVHRRRHVVRRLRRPARHHGAVRSRPSPTTCRTPAPSTTTRSPWRRARRATARSTRPAAAKELNERGEKIRQRLNAICQREKVAFQFSGIGSMMTAHATARPIKTAADIASGNQDAKELFFFDMMAAGIWIARRGFVALNIMIGDAEGDRFVAAVEEFVTARKALLQPK